MSLCVLCGVTITDGHGHVCREVNSSIVFDPDKVRRERIATAVLAGLSANTTFRDYTPRELAHHALENADALIKELDR